MLVYYETPTGYKSFDGVIVQDTKIKPYGFYLVKPYKATIEELKIYYQKLSDDLEELCDITKLDYKRLEILDYKKLIGTLFKIYRGDKKIKYDTIEFYEYEFFENCFNAGLNTATKGLYENVQAFDYKKFYAQILGGDKTTFKVPITKGKLQILKKIPPKKEIQYGIYRVKISSYSPNISKVFAFNENNYYTHIDLIRALDLSFSKRFDVKIELIQDKEPNALMYDELIDSKIIFIRYVKKIQEVLLTYPKNKLCKFLLSGLWGNLSQKGHTKKLTMNEYDELENKEKYNLVDIHTKYINNEFVDIFELLHINNIQQTNYRLKSFLTSQGRNKMSQNLTRIQNLDDIIRVCTDGVILTNEAKYTSRFISKEFIHDDKYNNKNIEIKNVNKISFFYKND